MVLRMFSMICANDRRATFQLRFLFSKIAPLVPFFKFRSE